MGKKLDPCPSCGKTCLATDRDTGAVACILCGMRAPSKEVWNCRAATEGNEPLTLEELNTRRGPVWCACDSFDGEGGYWCLCRNGEITPPSCRPFLAKDRPNWVFYRRPPEGGEG